MEKKLDQVLSSIQYLAFETKLLSHAIAHRKKHAINKFHASEKCDPHPFPHTQIQPPTHTHLEKFHMCLTNL